MKQKISILLIAVSLFTISLELAAQGIKIKPGTATTIQEGTTLKLTSGDLIIQSDSTGDATMIDRGTLSVTGGGTTKVERYVTGNVWHQISAPNSNTQGTLFEGSKLRYYVESNNSWHKFTPLTDTLNVMQGYKLKPIVTDDTTFVYSGKTNTGTYSYNFTEDGKGRNFIGNPYPSVLDWDEVDIPEELSAAFWVRDPSIGINGCYRYYIKGGGDANTTSQYIASGQGFKVKAVDGPGTLTFDNSVRTHGGQAFYKGETSEGMIILKISGNDVTTQMAIRYHPEASSGYDRNHDVHKLLHDESPEVPKLYSIDGDEVFAIHTVGSFDEVDSIPLGFHAGIEGEYTINATKIETIHPDIPVFLEDLKTNNIQDLRKNPIYTFDHQDTLQRDLLIHFKDVYGIFDHQGDYNAFKVKIWAENHRLHVNFDPSDPSNANFSARIDVIGLMGQNLVERETSSLTNVIPLSSNINILLVRVTKDNGIVTRKILNQ